MLASSRHAGRTGRVTRRLRGRIVARAPSPIVFATCSPSCTRCTKATKPGNCSRCSCAESPWPRKAGKPGRHLELTLEGFFMSAAFRVPRRPRPAGLGEHRQRRRGPSVLTALAAAVITVVGLVFSITIVARRLPRPSSGRAVHAAPDRADVHSRYRVIREMALGNRPTHRGASGVLKFVPARRNLVKLGTCGRCCAIGWSCIQSLEVVACPLSRMN